MNIHLGQPKIIGTHNGNFHADDVFAVAATMLLFPGSKVIRSRDENELKNADFIVDVGAIYDPNRCRFDHHQGDFNVTRPNGLPYASFGLIWKEFGERICGFESSKMIDDKLVTPIDALDNGVDIDAPLVAGIKRYDLKDIIDALTPVGECSDKEMDEAFMFVVRMAEALIVREIERANMAIAAREEVEKAYRASADKRIISLSKMVPWKDTLISKEEPLFVIYKRHDDKWAAQSVPISKNSFMNRHLFPESWAGKIEDELKEVSGVKDAVFCHNKRFFAVASTFSGAESLAKLALVN